MKPIIIAEIANSHYGDEARLLKICKELKEANAENIKFQMFKTEHLVSKVHKSFDLFKELEISEETWKKVSETIKNFNFNVYCDIFDEESLNISNLFKPKGIKIHSSSISDLNLIKNVQLDAMR